MGRGNREKGLKLWIAFKGFLGQNKSYMVEVSRLANLARLGLEKEEIDSIQKELDSILGYVSKLHNFPLNKDRDKSFLNNALVSGHWPEGIVREDSNPHELGIFTDKILNNAPEKEKGFIMVKKIL